VFAKKGLPATLELPRLRSEALAAAIEEL
jgi:hypothetical protein